MPTISEGALILVSGANGYIGCHVVRTLLERNYTVRGVVRSPVKGRHLQELFKSYGEKFELAIVKDITEEGAFDEAVKGVDGIVHTASPVELNLDDLDPQELIKPALNGTISILQSAINNGSKVKRVVVTSSCAAILHVSPEPKTFSEVDWNEQSVKEVEVQGIKAPGVTKYRASKTLAERAAWDMYKANKDKIGWDLVVINPPFVFGPPIHDTPTPDTLNASVRLWYNTVLVEGSLPEEFLCKQSSSFVDVRDLAEAHARSLEKEEAGGERIIVSAGPYVWNDWTKVAHSVRSAIPSHFKLAPGYPEFTPKEYALKYDTTKEAGILGIKYRSAETVAKDMLNDFGRRGW